MAKPKRVDSVFLNIPYDDGFEDLCLAYIVGLTQLGLRINVTLAVPNQGLLDAIIQLIERSQFSITTFPELSCLAGFHVSICL